jgi:V/A-type H+-transporting ATPase subunit C
VNLKANHNATVAKIMAIYGKSLKAEDYQSLINQRSVSEVAEYLKKNTYYSELLAPIDTNTIHRGMLENLLRRSVFEKYIKIISFEQIGTHEFYNYRILKAEIDEILSCIRHINAKSEEQIATTPIYLGNYASINFIELAKIRSFDELLEFLRRTPYYSELLEFKPKEGEKVDYNACEIKMRTYYINRLFTSIKKNFRKNLQDSLMFLLLTDIDLINVINSYRLITYFNESQDDIKKNMLPFHGRLTELKQREIITANDEEDFIKRFSKTYYGRQMAENGYNPNDIEQSAMKLRYRYAKLALKKSTQAPLSIYAFLYLMDNEVQNLIKIIEGIRYELDPKKIEALIFI